MNYRTQRQLLTSIAKNSHSISELIQNLIAFCFNEHMADDVRLSLSEVKRRRGAVESFLLRYQREGLVDTFCDAFLAHFTSFKELYNIARDKRIEQKKLSEQQARRKRIEAHEQYIADRQSAPAQAREASRSLEILINSLSNMSHSTFVDFIRTEGTQQDREVIEFLIAMRKQLSTPNGRSHIYEVLPMNPKTVLNSLDLLQKIS